MAFPCRVKNLLILLLAVAFSGSTHGQIFPSPVPGYEVRIRNHVDSLRVIDTHEHLFTPEILKGSFFLDFSMLFQTNAYEDLLSVGMPGKDFGSLFNEQVSPVQKWKIIEPFWSNSFVIFCNFFNYAIVIF